LERGSPQKVQEESATTSHRQAWYDSCLRGVLSNGEHVPSHFRLRPRALAGSRARCTQWALRAGGKTRSSGERQLASRSVEFSSLQQGAVGRQQQRQSLTAAASSTAAPKGRQQSSAELAGKQR
jgi:hypothetical protein